MFNRRFFQGIDQRASFAAYIEPEGSSRLISRTEAHCESLVDVARIQQLF